MARAPVQQRPTWRMPLLRAVCEHGADLAIARPAPRPVDEPRDRTFVAIAEDRPLSRGPNAFEAAALAELIRAVKTVVIMIGAPDPEAYRLAVAVVEAGVSVLVVETDLKHRRAWRARCRAVAGEDLPIKFVGE